MGPDEFHEMLPENQQAGLKDNFYTNIMVAWLFAKIKDVITILGNKNTDQIFHKINLVKEQVDKWQTIKNNLHFIISKEGVFPQFDGYFTLKDLDWEYYTSKYGNIQRMDRILRAERKSPDEYKVSKQADVLMAFYLLPVNEIEHLLSLVNLQTPQNLLQKNFEYYFQRTSHGSTLSEVVHSHLLNLLKKPKLGYKLFINALKSDYIDIQGGSTGEGIHVGVMAGTILEVLFSFLGIDLSADKIKIIPNLPNHWRTISTKFLFKNVKYQVVMKQKQIKILAESKVKNMESIYIKNKKYSLNLNGKAFLDIK